MLLPFHCDLLPGIITALQFPAGPEGIFARGETKELEETRDSWLGRYLCESKRLAEFSAKHDLGDLA